MKIGIVDNYDSFTYNLMHYLEEITGSQPYVGMNDKLDWGQLELCTHLVLSPGPGLPKESGDLMKVIERFYQKKNILGVCLGMQALAQFFDGDLKNLDEVQHGTQTKIFVSEMEDNLLYKNLPLCVEVGRYHSWVLDESKLPTCLVVTARDEKMDVMSIQHTTLPIYAVQYHPESIMTDMGKRILRNWLEI